jgi:hypothetical protein
MEKHRKVQELIWLEDIPKGWDVPPKSPLTVDRSSLDTDAKNLDEDGDEEGYEMNVGSEQGTSSVYMSDNSYGDEDYEEDYKRGETSALNDAGNGNQEIDLL